MKQDNAKEKKPDFTKDTFVANQGRPDIASEDLCSPEEMVSVRFLKSCCRFIPGTLDSGRPQQIVYQRDTVAAFKRDELGSLQLMEIVKPEGLSQRPPDKYIILGK